MFDRVTVLTDGGPNGLRALRAAGRLAAAADLPLEAVVAVDERIADVDDEAFRIELVHQAPVPCIARVRRGHDTVDTMVEVVEHRPDALVALGTRGHSAVGEAVLGSVAETLLVRSEHPLLLVGPHSAEVDGIGGRVVAAVEDETAADALGPSLASCVAQFGLEPWFVQVVDPVAWNHRPEIEALDSALLHRVAARFGARHHMEAAWDVLHGHDTPDTIVQFAAERGGGIVTIATRRWADPAHRHWSSVARRLVARSPFPVLVVPVHEALVEA